MTENSPATVRNFLLLLLQRSTAVQVRSSVQLMPQSRPSGRGLPQSPTVWSPDQHLVAMLADVSRPISSKTEGRGLGFGQLVRTHTGKCLKCQSSSDGDSNHSALCAGGRQLSAGPAPVSTRKELRNKRTKTVASMHVQRVQRTRSIHNPFSPGQSLGEISWTNTTVHSGSTEAFKQAVAKA